MGKRVSTAAILRVGFAAGLGFANLSGAIAARNEAKVDVTHAIREQGWKMAFCSGA